MRSSRRENELRRVGTGVDRAVAAAAFLVVALLFASTAITAQAPAPGSVRQVDGARQVPLKPNAPPPSASVVDSAWTDARKAEMAANVRAEFLHAWQGYRQYAWGHDELLPLSKGFKDWYGTSLYMTPVDALDTLILMGLNEQADGTRELIAKNLSFDKDIYVKNFEITIRMMGGLLSSYQLTGDRRLLALAEDLGKRLLPAFNSPTGMPYVFVNLKTGAVRGVETNPAEVGTLLLEFGTLSKLTGKPVYYDKAKRALVEIYNRRSPIGLVGSSINVETGKWTDSDSHVSGGIDSYYEYLLKAWILFGDADCERMWKQSIAGLNQYVADDAASGLWYGHVDMVTGKRAATEFGALDAFFPAVLALSGDLARAQRLLDSCYRMWTTYGIEPEVFDYSTMKATAFGYELRPEIVESTYYVYFFTGNPRYLQMGQTYFDALVKNCRTETGYAALRSVESMQKKDAMESFFFAETLKYLYLLCAPKATLDLRAVVFNTEAHPLRRTWK
ncbi:MAG TPA: glycoside hydrolase family 47 protein [Terriglobales bacterium]